jgi:hypothetical protein
VTASTGVGRGVRPLLTRCRQGHADYTLYGVARSRACKVCTSIAARRRYELIRDAAAVVGMSIRDYKAAYTSRCSVAVAVLSGADPLAR